MPYIPPHLRPGYVRKAVVEVTRRRGVHFPTNAHNANNRTTNITVPNGSKRNGKVRKPALKRTVRVSPKSLPAMPTSNVEKLPKKFRDMLLKKGIKHLASPD